MASGAGLGELRRLLAKAGSYGVSVVVTLLVGLFSVPAIIRMAGPQEWAGIAVTQAVAAIASVLVAFGWTVTGPALIAGAETAERHVIFWRSVVARTVLACAVVPASALISALLSGLPTATAVVASTSYLLPALGASWFFVGEGRPLRLLLLDTFPRALGVVMGVGALWLTGDLLAFSMVMLVVGILGLLTAYAVVLGPFRGDLRGIRIELRRTLSAQRHGLATTTAATVYVNSPLVIASVVLTGGIESFALASRIFGYAVTGFQPVVQLAQGWVPSGSRSSIRARALRASKLSLLLAGIAGVGTALFMPLIGTLLSTGLVHIPLSLSIPLGVSVGAVVVSQIVGLSCLTALDEQKVLASSTVAGAVVGIVLLFGLGVVMGASGLAVAMAGAECLVSAWQLMGLRRALSKPPTPI